MTDQYSFIDFSGHPATADGPFYHGTRADLRVGDLLVAGRSSNYRPGLTMNHIYFSAMLQPAVLAAALATGAGPERVYEIVPTGSFEDDPNVTNKRFPGNPTRSFRSTAPLRIVREVSAFDRLSAEEIAAWREKIANAGGEIIN